MRVEEGTHFADHKDRQQYAKHSVFIDGILPAVGKLKERHLNQCRPYLLVSGSCFDCPTDVS